VAISSGTFVAVQPKVPTNTAPMWYFQVTKDFPFSQINMRTNWGANEIVEGFYYDLDSDCVLKEDIYDYVEYGAIVKINGKVGIVDILFHVANMNSSNQYLDTWLSFS
jgi:hypothetical protein